LTKELTYCIIVSKSIERWFEKMFALVLSTIALLVSIAVLIIVLADECS